MNTASTSNLRVGAVVASPSCVSFSSVTVSSGVGNGHSQEITTFVEVPVVESVGISKVIASNVSETALFKNISF